MKLLVTGGTGFIGSALVGRLLERGDEVTLWVRSPDKAKRQHPSSVRIITELGALAKDDHLDAVVNLAGEPILDRRWSDRRKQLLIDSRIGLTRQLADHLAQLDQPPSVLVSGSAIGYYGNHDGDEPLDENGRVMPGFTHELCADWEAEAQSVGRLGTRVCLLRTGVVLGEGGGALARMLPAFRFGLGGPIGHGRQWFSWIHKEDMLALILYLLDHPTLSGPFNATAPEPVTNACFSQTLGEVLKRPAALRMPAGVLTLLLGEAAELLVGGQRVLPARLLDSGFTFRYPTLKGALQATLNSAS